MGCDAGDACVHDHVLPYLRQPKPGSDGRGYRALAPCHRDTEHSLSVSTGDSGRPVWCCHACKHRLGTRLMLTRTREALIDDGVPERCLPLPADEARDLLGEIRAIVFGGGSRCHNWLRIAALLEGYDGLPGGEELETLAAECGVSVREAYKARAGLQPITGTAHQDQPVVKPRRSGVM